MHRRVSRHRRRERGAALVEAALVFPIVAMCTFGIIEYGLLTATSAGATSAAQVGARHGSATVAADGTPAAALDEVRTKVERALSSIAGQAEPVSLWLFRADDDGTPVGVADFSSCRTDCRRYRWNGSGFVHAGGAWVAPDACLFDGDGVDNVGVRVVVRYHHVTGFLGSTTTFDEHTTLRLEPLPSEQC